jgi:hypothetical protein
MNNKTEFPCQCGHYHDIWQKLNTVRNLCWEGWVEDQPKENGCRCDGFKKSNLVYLEKKYKESLDE